MVTMVLSGLIYKKGSPFTKIKKIIVSTFLLACNDVNKKMAFLVDTLR